MLAGSTLAATVLAALALAGPVTGSGSAPPASSLDAGFAHTRLSGAALEPATRGSARPLAGTSAAAKPPRLELAYYIGVDFQEIPPGGAQLFEIRCPDAAEKPIAGGSFAPSPGLVVVNSSRFSPSTEVPTAPRAWYQAVVNIMQVPLQWKPIVTCGRRK